MEKNTDSYEPYLADLREIRQLLERNEEKPLIESWAFITWAIAILIGTALNWVFFAVQSFSFQDSLFRIWVPVMIVGGTFESIGFFSRYRKSEIPLFSRQSIKTFMFVFGMFFSATVVFAVMLKPENPLPGLFLTFLSGAFFLLGYATFMVLFLPAVIALCAGIVFILAGWNTPEAYLVSGLISAFCFLTGGIQSRLREKRNHG